MLEHKGGEIRKIFNTSGLDYKAQGLKDRLPSMSTAEAIELLSKNGNLVKRPFVVDGDWGTAGFNEAEWKDRLDKHGPFIPRN